MGKASAVANRLRTRPLSPAEIRAQQTAIAIADPDVYPTTNGQFVRAPMPRRETTRYVHIHTRRIVHETTYSAVHTEVVGEASRREWD
jgi:hypothetical protein